ncbi:hypothetical protein Esti_002409 [Eimeria stiedai]
MPATPLSSRARPSSSSPSTLPPWWRGIPAPRASTTPRHDVLPRGRRRGRPSAPVPSSGAPWWTPASTLTNLAARPPPRPFCVCAVEFRGLDLGVPKQLPAGLVAVECLGHRPVHLRASGPLGRVQALPVFLTSLRRVPLSAAGGASSRDSPALSRHSRATTRSLGGLCPASFRLAAASLPPSWSSCTPSFTTFAADSMTAPELLQATTLLQPYLETGVTPPISPPPRRHSPPGCRMVDMLLGCVKLVSAIGFIDIILFSDMWTDQYRHLQGLLHVLRNANLQLNPRKCAFGAAEVKYPGRIVSRESIRAGLYNVQGMDMPSPSTAKAVQRFLGECRYHRKFVPNFEATAAPLFRAATRKHAFECTSADSGPLLAHPEYQREFFVDCLGSRDGLGAVLPRPYEDGKRVLAYSFRALLDHERRGAETELEAAAAVWALETFRRYTDRIHVTVWTDRAPLKYISSKMSQCRRLDLLALRLRLQGFRLMVTHRRGSQQKQVDCLSRAPVPPTSDQKPWSQTSFPLAPSFTSAVRRARPAWWRLLDYGPLCDEMQRRAHRCHFKARLFRRRILTISSEPPAPSPSEGIDIEVVVFQDEDAPSQRLRHRHRSRRRRRAGHSAAAASLFSSLFLTETSVTPRPKTPTANDSVN